MSCILQEILSHSFSSNSALCAFQAGSQRTVLTETRYSFFLPAHECEQLMDHRWVFPLSLYFLEGIFRSIGKLVRFFPLPTLPQFAWPTPSVDRAHASFSWVMKITVTEGKFDSLQSDFIATEENDPYFPKIFLWVRVWQSWLFGLCQAVISINQPLLPLAVWFAKWKFPGRESLKKNVWT